MLPRHCGPTDGPTLGYCNVYCNQGERWCAAISVKTSLVPKAEVPKLYNSLKLTDCPTPSKVKYNSSKGFNPCSIPRVQSFSIILGFTIHPVPFVSSALLDIIHYKLCTLHYALCTMHYTLYTIHCALCTMHYALYTIHYALCSMHCIIHRNALCNVVVHGSERHPLQCIA
jgi:hypothetical protein